MDELTEKIKEFILSVMDDTNRLFFQKPYEIIKKWIKKFNTAELIIIVLIAGAVLAATIPTIRLLIRSTAPKTGVFKCYYNKDGVLVQENTADRRHKGPQPVKNGFCVFKMLDENKTLEITIIGGGGGGSASSIAQNQRNIEFDPISREINVLSDDLVIKNPFNKRYVTDEDYTEKFLSKLSLAVAGGGGGSLSGSNETSGMGGICAIKQGTLHIGDRITRKSGQNGTEGRDGTDGTLIYSSSDNGTVQLIASGGKGVLNISSDVRKNGECSDSKYAAGHYRNESSMGSIASKTDNQAFFNNFSISKIRIEDQTEKIKAIKGRAGSKGEVITFKAKNLSTFLKICEQGSKERCQGYVGKGGKGGVITNKNTVAYVEDISGKDGMSTTFMDKVAQGGKGGIADVDKAVYLSQDQLILNGENGRKIDGSLIQNSGGNCRYKNNCDAQDDSFLGSSGAGGGLMYRTTYPFQSTLVAKVIDAQNRQIGTAVQFIETKKADYSSDKRYMGNGGNGGSGAVIIRW